MSVTHVAGSIGYRRKEEKDGEVMIEDEAAEIVGTRLGLAMVCSAVCIFTLTAMQAF